MVITAYLSIGSTYTYLTALRLRSVIESQDAAFDFKPFSVRAIMREMNNIPFPPEKKAKVAYMWRDIERRAARYGLQQYLSTTCTRTAMDPLFTRSIRTIPPTQEHPLQT